MDKLVLVRVVFKICDKTIFVKVRLIFKLCWKYSLVSAFMQFAESLYMLQLQLFVSPPGFYVRHSYKCTTNVKRTITLIAPGVWWHGFLQGWIFHRKIAFKKCFPTFNSFPILFLHVRCDVFYLENASQMGIAPHLGNEREISNRYSFKAVEGYLEFLICWFNFP